MLEAELTLTLPGYADVNTAFFLDAEFAGHNMIEAMPLHGNKKYLTDVLRHRFGLGEGGYIGSDEGNVYGLAQGGFGVATDAADASVLWLTSGGDQAMLDMCMGAPNAHRSGIPTSPCNAARLVNESLLAQSVLDRAAGNILRAKFVRNLVFTSPFPIPTTLPFFLFSKELLSRWQRWLRNAAYAFM